MLSGAPASLTKGAVTLMCCMSSHRQKRRHYWLQVTQLVGLEFRSASPSPDWVLSMCPLDTRYQAGEHGKAGPEDKWAVPITSARTGCLAGQHSRDTLTLEMDTATPQGLAPCYIPIP